MGITRFEERKERWDAGEVTDVSGVGENFTKGQYWTREVRRHYSLPITNSFSHAAGMILYT